jgi:hypothetical protein
MSFNRLTYDTCSYNQVLLETTGPGIYQIGTPQNVCKPCHPSDPYIRLQGMGASVSRNTPLIDVDSELLGIVRNNSRCPERKYLPGCGIPIQGNANAGACAACQKNSKLCLDHDKTAIEFNNCFTNTEDTRLSNPPCTLRSTGWNRWEWLPLNPQDRVETPFDFEIDSRRIAKDNHRPCIPKPLDQTLVYPRTDNKPMCDSISAFCGVPTSPPSVHWQSMSNIVQY